MGMSQEVEEAPIFEGLRVAEAPVHVPPVTIVRSEEAVPTTDAVAASAVEEEHIISQPAVLTEAEEEQQGRPQHFVDTEGHPVSYVDEFGQPANYEEKEEDRIENKVPTIVRSIPTVAGQPNTLPATGALSVGSVPYVVSSQQNIAVRQHPLTMPQILPVTQPLGARPLGSSQVLLSPQPLLAAPTMSMGFANLPSQPQVQQPAVFNVSPEVFARLMQGGALSSAEMKAITSNVTAAVPEVASPDLGSATQPTDPAAQTSSNKEGKAPKKKALKSSKKRNMACC